MKRSEINLILREMEEMIRLCRFPLPPFCGFTAEQWLEKDNSFDEIRDNKLGWDVTDYGSGDFSKVGMALLTLRNGNQQLAQQYPKPYAEKLLYLREGQYSPMHFHWFKMEDIINRGGGRVMIQVFGSTGDELLDRESPVWVSMDGQRIQVSAGTVLTLAPGQSITITPGLYHDFRVEAGTGAVLLGEVSQCNDDENDNRFLNPVGRFPVIEEDEKPWRLLCTEYPACRGMGDG